VRSEPEQQTGDANGSTMLMGGNTIIVDGSTIVWVEAPRFSVVKKEVAEIGLSAPEKRTRLYARAANGRSDGLRRG
jgi:hypothetical protein